MRFPYVQNSKCGRKKIIQRLLEEKFLLKMKKSWFLKIYTMLWIYLVCPSNIHFSSSFLRTKSTQRFTPLLCFGDADPPHVQNKEQVQIGLNQSSKFYFLGHKY